MSYTVVSHDGQKQVYFPLLKANLIGRTTVKGSNQVKKMIDEYMPAYVNGKEWLVKSEDLKKLDKFMRVSIMSEPALDGIDIRKLEELSDKFSAHNIRVFMWSDESIFVERNTDDELIKQQVGDLICIIKIVDNSKNILQCMCGGKCKHKFF